jgi:hypothetical protein
MLLVAAVLSTDSAAGVACASIDSNQLLLVFGIEYSKGCIPQYLRPCKILIFFAAATLDVILVS